MKWQCLLSLFFFHTFVILCSSMKWNTRWYLTAGFLPCQNFKIKTYFFSSFYWRTVNIMFHFRALQSRACIWNFEFFSQHSENCYFPIWGRFCIWRELPDMMWRPWVIQAEPSRRWETFISIQRGFSLQPFSLNSICLSIFYRNCWHRTVTQLQFWRLSLT